jgi:RNA polymerase sigma-70 factor (ECF subfamily)
MDLSDASLERLIQRACQGDRVALGELLDRHRAYLKVLALRQLDSRLDSRLDASDLVQQTCLSVFGRIQQFQGVCEAEFLAWLRTVHGHNIQNSIRDHLRSQKRSVAREDRWGNEKLAVEPNSPDQPSASQRLMISEDAVRLAAALDQLPPGQAEAVRLRFLEGRSMSEIADTMERSVDSVAGLIKRGMSGLKRQLHEPD